MANRLTAGRPGGEEGPRRWLRPWGPWPSRGSWPEGTQCPLPGARDAGTVQVELDLSSGRSESRGDVESVPSGGNAEETCLRDHTTAQV